VSPANSLKLNLDTSCTFAPYSNDEVREILSASFGEQESWKKWLPALAAYTGSRRGEIVQLRKQDVKFDSDSGRYYLLITGDAGSIKNRNATRQIPLHNFLLDRGFLDFVNEAGDRLFGDLKSESVTQWFVSLRDKLKIEKFDDFGSRKVFHSLRHSFITRSRGAGNPLDQIQQVVGHEKASIGITDRYSHIQPLKIVLDVVDKVGYE
jgi:integrase